MANNLNIKKVLRELSEDSERMLNLSMALQNRGLKDVATKLDEDALILLKIEREVRLALKADGVDIEDD